MYILTYDNAIGFLTLSWKTWQDNSEVIDKFAKYGVNINPRLAHSGGSYDRYEITFNTWQHVFDGASAYLLAYNLEFEHAQWKYACSILIDAVNALHHTGIDITQSAFYVNLKEKLSSQYNELRSVQEKLTEAASLLELEVAEPVLLKEEEQMEETSLLELLTGIIDLITLNNRVYLDVITKAHKLCEKHNEQASIAKTIAQDAKTNLPNIGKYLLPENEFEIIESYNSEIKTIDVEEITKLISKIVELQKIIDELISFNGDTEVTELDKLIYQYASIPSPIIWIIHDEKLNENQKLLLIQKLALERPSQASKANIDIAGGEPRYRYNYDQRSPFHHAVEFGSFTVVQLLIKLGGHHWQAIHEGFAQRTFSHVEGTTALHLAAKRGDSQILELLLENGVSVNVQDNNGQTALHLAKNSECAAILLQYRANPNIVDRQDNTPLHLICKKQLEGPRFDWEDTEAYQKKVIDNLEQIELLIKVKTNINKQNVFGYTALHYSVITYFMPGGYNDYDHILSKVKLLCENGALVNVRSFPKKPDDYRSGNDENNFHPAPNTSPLLCIYKDRSSVDDGIVMEKQLAIVKELIKNGADTFCFDDDGYTILHILLKRSDIHAVKYLLEQLPQERQLVNFQADQYSPTPLHLALHWYVHINDYFDLKKDMTLLQMLLEAGADINALCAYRIYRHSYSFTLNDRQLIGEEKLTPYQYALKVNNQDGQLAANHSPLRLIKQWETHLKEKNLKALKSKFNVLMNSYRKMQQEIDLPEQVYSQFNMELNDIVQDMVELSKTFPQAFAELTHVYLFIIEHSITILASKQEVSDVIQYCRLAFEAARNAFDDESPAFVEQLKKQLYELVHKCLVIPSKTTFEKRMNIAAAVACFLAAEREFGMKVDPNETFKGLLVELMGLKLNAKDFSLEMLEKNYPSQYHNAWAAVNKQSVELFYNGDTFTDKKFVTTLRMTKNVSIIKHGAHNHYIWHKKLPQTDTLQAQDDDQCERVYKKPSRTNTV